MSIGDWLHIDWEMFHFLRPGWLSLFVPMLIVLLVAMLGNRSKKDWQKVIAAHLRPFVIAKGSQFTVFGPLVLFAFVMSLLIIAAAGPTWKKIEVPGTKSEAILLIGLDLSASMLVEDVSPNRLERAKFKIRDLLQANPGSRVGLFVYAGTAHPVITPCKDYELVQYQLESLGPGIMPLPGTSISQALELADTIFSRTEAPGTLLLFTDNINQEEAGHLKGFVKQSNQSVELIACATPQGGKIPAYRRGSYFRENGNDVISRLDQGVLFDLQKHPKINVNTLTLDKQDVENIAEKVKKNLVFRSVEEESEEDWVEMGYGLLWIGVLLFAFWFRKGWMIQWCVALGVFVSCSQKVESWNDLWYTKDYQGQQFMEIMKYQQAAEQYESLPHKGVAYYKAGDYESAIRIFSQDTSATSMYNLGLTYAANGQNDLARETLRLAQILDPENESIKKSIEKNEAVIRQIDSLRSVNPDQAIELKDQEEQGALIEREAKGKDEELTSDTEVKELPKGGDRVTDEVESGMRKAEEMERPPEDFQPQRAKAAQNVLLREISVDPSEFLKRRFRYQYEKYYKSAPKSDKPW